MTECWYPAYVGIGSNLDSPADRVRQAIEKLKSLPMSFFALASPLYVSAPLGPAGQPDYVNAVVAMMTRLQPAELLGALQGIEAEAGRARSERWGPRVLDLDLLSWSAAIIDSDTLVLPHPGIADRNFVLLPWREITPFVQVPGLGMVCELAEKVPLEPRIHVLTEA